MTKEIYIFCTCLRPEKYFDMKKVQCKEGLDIYKKFLTRMTRISEFLKVAEVSDPRVASYGIQDHLNYGLKWI